MIFAVHLFAIVCALFILAGCQTFHTGLTDAKFTQRVHDRFDSNMTTDEVRSELRSMRFDEIRTWEEDDPEEGIAAGDLGAVVWPERFISIIPGVMDYYGRDIILFRFGGDNALDDVVRRPFGWLDEDDAPLVIDLNKSEQTP